MRVKEGESSRICRAVRAIKSTGGFEQRNSLIIFKGITGCCAENRSEGMEAENRTRQVVTTVTQERARRLRSREGQCRWQALDLFFFNKFIYLFLAALGLHCCAQAFSSCSERGLLFVVVCRLLTAVASLVAEHRL